MSAQVNQKSQKKEAKNAAPAEEGGFLQNLLGMFFKSSNPEAEKKRRLKLVAKNFSKTKFHNFYKPGTFEMMPPLAKLMYDIYKVIYQAQLMYKAQPNLALFKRRIINYVMTEKQLEVMEQLDEDNIVELSRKIPVNNLQQQVEEKLAEFSAAFDDARIARAENLCKAFNLFRDFCLFDFYMFLKKFDSSLQEGSFTSAPNFQKINAEYLVEPLKDFIDVAFAVTDDTVVWTDFFDMLKATQGKEFVSPTNWKKIVTRIRSIQVSGAFDMIIQMVSKDPGYESQIKVSLETIIEPFVEKFQSDTRRVIQQIVSEQKESKSNAICVQIFGNAEPNSIRYYSDDLSNALAKKELSVFEYTAPLNYLKTFLIEYLKKDIREFFDVVVIRGQWDSSLSAPFSNAYQELLKVSDDITDFDNSLADDGVVGMKIKTLILKVPNDHGAENIINRLVGDANETARTYLISSTQNFISMGKTMKMLIEDYSKSKPTVVQNWKEIEKFIETPFKEFSVGIYKKIYLFVQLMQQYIAD